MNKRPSIDELQRIFVGRLLVPQLHFALQDAHDRRLAGLDLTTRQASLLASVDIGEANTPADLSRIYRIDASSITRMVERLVKKGFLSRKRSKGDRRQVLLEITPEGKTCLWEAIPIAMHTAKRAWRGVTDKEKETLGSIVRKVLANLDETSGPLNHPIEAKGE